MSDNFSNDEGYNDDAEVLTDEQIEDARAEAEAIHFAEIDELYRQHAWERATLDDFPTIDEMDF